MTEISGSDVALIIGAFGTLISAVASSIAVVLTAMNRSTSLTNTKKIEEVHIATNGMKNELVATTAKASYAEGLLEGKAQNGDAHKQPRTRSPDSA